MAIKTKLTRRTVLKAATLLTPTAFAISGCATMQREPKLTVHSDDPVARAVLYYPNSNNVPTNHPLAATHQPSQTCATCVHVRGKAGDNPRKCPTFPGRLINAEGWCSLWAKS